MSKIKRLAIIPARCGSKRILNKNIRKFCGRPIIHYVLDIINESKLFDTVHVSTDCEQIRKIVTDFGCPPDFVRPTEIADDQTPLMPVLKYVCEKYLKQGKDFDQIWLLMPTSPFLEVKDLVMAENLFSESESSKSILAVSEYQVPIEWAFERAKGGVLKPLQQGMLAIRSQDLSPKYHDTGSFSIFSMNDILSSVGVGNNFNFVGYVLPKYKAIDIDTLDDWYFAEALYRGMRGG
tara:strand:- start:7148 stop:7855 length:708 start_codon:yes stop_codon:yes gene_type:complete